MRPLGIFEDYIKTGIVVIQVKNESRCRDLVEESQIKFKSFQNTLNKIGLSNENANDAIEFCYDIIIYLIRAKMISLGFNSSGTGAHEAEVSYLRELKFSENEVQFMNNLRYFRNGIMYYGKRFEAYYAKQVIAFMNNMRNKLLKLLA